MAKENDRFGGDSIDLFRIELEARSAQAQAFKDKTCRLALAVVRLGKDTTAHFGGLTVNGMSASLAYCKRLLAMKRDTVRTSER